MGEKYASIVLPFEDWMDHGTCRGSDTMLFFGRTTAEAAAAKAICRGCPVNDNCLSYALAHWQIDGIWGGTSRRDRQRLRKQTRRSKMGS